MYQMCDLDGLIKLYPYAVIHIFYCSIKFLVTGSKYAPYLPAKCILCIAVFISGLTVIDRKQTQSKIAKTIGHVTHDDLNRLANSIQNIFQHIVMSIIPNIISASGTGYLILDDVIIPKPFAHWMSAAYVDYDYTQKKHIVCQRIVIVIWTNGLIYIPLAFSFWHQRDFATRYRTKNQIARVLIYWVVRRNIPFAYLTFDNWYASKQNMRLFSKLGIKFITRLRENTWLIHDNVEKKVSHLIKCECHYYGKLNAYVRRFLVKYPGFDMGYLAIVKKDKHDEPGRTKYLFTNDLTLTNTEMVLRYRSRWHIEIFFRNCKQHFGFSACQAQMMQQIIHHVRMVFLAYTLTQLLMTDKTMSIEQQQKHLRSLHCLRLSDEAPKLVSMQNDGSLKFVSSEEFINPIRTWFPDFLDFQSPNIIESMSIV